MREIRNGSGALRGAAGRITSTFVVNREGRVSDREVALVSSLQKGQFKMRRLLALLAVPAALVAATPASATFPGDNGRLVFQRPAGDQTDVYTIKPNGKRLKRVLDTPVIEEEAAWSPDGRRIAFARSAKGGFPTEIWTASPNGGDLQRATHWNDLATQPSWTADGRIVYFTTKDFPQPTSPKDPPPPAELYSMGADGADQRRLTSDEVIQTDPAVSPVDGTVAFTKWQPVAGEPGVFDLGIFSIGPDGSGERTLAPFSPDRDAINPIWSPDGTKIVFEVASASPPARPGSSDRQSDLAVMSSDGTGVRQGSPGPGRSRRRRYRLRTDASSPSPATATRSSRTASGWGRTSSSTSCARTELGFGA